jgi:hypothetical protein
MQSFPLLGILFDCLLLLSSATFSSALHHVSTYAQLLGPTVSVPDLSTPTSLTLDLEAKFRSLRKFFAPDRAESDALHDAADFDWSPEVLDRDISLLKSLGSLDAVINHHADQHKLSGLNSQRVQDYLSDDPHFAILKEIAEVGGK